jgi:hypothetical protein
LKEKIILIIATDADFVLSVIFRAFDVELLYIAQRLNIPITEMAVNWQEIDGMNCKRQK